MPRAARKWTQEEDNLLLREVNAQLREGKVSDWTVIANKITDRTNKDCRKRWHNALSREFNKGYWTKEEDQLLTQAVQAHGEIWTAVAEVVTIRSADQCAKRWKQCLDPQLDHSEWTEEECRRLVEIAALKGRRWKDIQIEHFPSRSRNSIKNQYTILTRRESRLKDGRTRKVRQNHDRPTTRETARVIDSSTDDGDDAMDEDEESCDEEEEANAEERDRLGPSNLWEGQRGPSSSSNSNSNPTLDNPDKNSACAGPDLSVWDKSPAELSGPSWDQMIASDFNGTLPDLSTLSADVLQGLGCNGLDDTKHGLYADLLYPSPTDMSGLFGPGDLEMAGLESHQQAIMPLQGTAMARANSQDNKVVLTIEGADHMTVEALMQIAFSSGSRFNLTRE